LEIQVQFAKHVEHPHFCSMPQAGCEVMMFFFSTWENPGIQAIQASKKIMIDPGFSDSL
jgi:hypothetical protein